MKRASGVIAVSLVTAVVTVAATLAPATCGFSAGTAKDATGVM